MTNKGLFKSQIILSFTVFIVTFILISIFFYIGYVLTPGVILFLLCSEWLLGIFPSILFYIVNKDYRTIVWEKEDK